MTDSRRQTMYNFIEYIQGISQLDNEASDDLLKDLKTKTFNKNDFLLKSNGICKYFFFIEEGLIKSFFYNKDKEFIMAFFQENMMFTELSSYLTQRPSKYMLIALENTTLKCIHREAIEKLCKRHHCIETLIRKLFTMTSVCFMDRIGEMLEENAKERYDNFINSYPNLLQRINLGDLASYIGITQVSLSRIRANK